MRGTSAQPAAETGPLRAVLWSRQHMGEGVTKGHVAGEREPTQRGAAQEKARRSRLVASIAAVAGVVFGVHRRDCTLPWVTDTTCDGPSVAIRSHEPVVVA